MAYWTPDHDALLSCLLDDVTGTEETVQLMKDRCAINDCLTTLIDGSAPIYQMHFAGSKSEGLELAGSDRNS